MTREPFFSTVYAIGSPYDRFYGQLVFKADGGVAGYAHSNEASWQREGNELTFFNQDNHPTSSFSKEEGGLVFTGYSAGSLWPVCLIPILTLDDCAVRNENFPPVMINSIPKSGTYFLESVFAQLGWNSTRLHLLTGGVIDDNRGIADEMMHVKPEAVRRFCSLECLCALLQPSDMMVGHIHATDEINLLRSHGCLDVSIIRNLRDVLVSFYRFKKTKAKPAKLSDELWRTMDGEIGQFLGFLSYFSDKDLESVGLIAKSMLDDPHATVLRYEDVIAGAISDEFAGTLNGIEDGLAVRFSETLKAKLYTPNSTYSGKISQWQHFWDARVEHYFADSGLLALNHRLGYE